mmetsp:Transcript_97813/g.273833  ORF Transcript_97813/g.273833 Transcript_97813/m.273833 type:complete len:227 (+) Transcript_97813:392-1072(+)
MQQALCALPARERHHRELRPHGTTLGVCHPRQIKCESAQASGLAYRAAIQPEAEQGENGGDHVRGVRRSHVERVYSGRLGALRGGTHDGVGLGQRRGRHAHLANLPRLRPPPLHQSHGHRRPGAQHTLGKVVGGGLRTRARQRCVPHEDDGAAARAQDEGALLLCRLGSVQGVPRAGDVQAPGWPRSHAHRRAVADARGALRSVAGGLRDRHAWRGRDGVEQHLQV